MSDRDKIIVAGADALAEFWGENDAPIQKAAAVIDAALAVRGSCPECGGDGDDRSVEAARYYAETGIISPCELCDGSGEVPLLTWRAAYDEAKKEGR